MPGGQTGCTHGVNIIFNRHARGLLRCLKHGADIHIKSEIRKTGGDHFYPAVVTILPHFGYQDSRTAPLFFQEFVGAFPHGKSAL